MKKRKKSLVAYIYKCEFYNVLYWQDDEWVAISEDYMPFKHKRTEVEEQKVCSCPGKHPMQKVRITIEEI